jgi:uncharacterized membrane protein YidH (DUF202 family)
MWFRVLSVLIAVALLGKAAIALVAPQRFYNERQRQYASEARPRKLLVAPVVIVVITLAAWYATIFQYQSWGWVVTGCLTALSCLSVDHLLRWERHRQRMLRVVMNPKVWWVDCVLLVVGSLFVALAFCVY